MSRHLGDYATSTVIYGKFTTYRPSTGAAFTLAGTPALSVYKDNSTTQSTTGVTLTVDFDAVTGLHHFAIDTSADGTFYSAGSNFDIVITTGTVDSVSVVGTVVGSFSIAKTSALRPTTVGRTLDVTAGGCAGVDWANVESPTTTLGLTNTTVGTVTTLTGHTPQTGDSYARIGATGSGLTSLASQASVDAIDNFVDTEIADIQSRLPAALVGGRMDASVGAMATNVMTASALATDAVTEIQSGLATASDMATVAGYIDTEITTLISELAKVPKSDGTATWNATALAAIQSEATDALNAYDPPTNAEMVARTLAAADYFDPATDTVATVTTLTNLPAITSNWLTAAGLAADAVAEIQSGLASQTSVDDIPTVAEFELRTPTAAQLAYIVANAATGLPVTFTTSGGSTTAAVLNQVDGAAASATNDQYNGRLLVFTDGTLKGVVTDITDYVGGTTTATITAIPFAPTSSHNARLI